MFAVLVLWVVNVVVMVCGDGMLVCCRVCCCCWLRLKSVYQERRDGRYGGGPGLVI